MARHPGRAGTEWSRVRRAVLRDHPPCWLCGGAIDYDAPPRSPLAPSVDHVVALKSMRGLDPIAQRRLALDPDLLRPAHYACNSRRGARPPAAPPATAPRRTSREW